MLMFTVGLSMCAFLRALDEAEPHPQFWAFMLAASLGLGLLLKSLIGVLFPLAAGVIYLSISHQLFSAATWRRFRPFRGLLIILLIAAPWHILATLRNPPYFAFTLHSALHIMVFVVFLHQ
jgi:4-amino-4-deoxy-L-arabinose transferase-like glycosyltransferase